MVKRFGCKALSLFVVFSIVTSMLLVFGTSVANAASSTTATITSLSARQNTSDPRHIIVSASINSNCNTPYQPTYFTGTIEIRDRNYQLVGTKTINDFILGSGIRNFSYDCCLNPIYLECGTYYCKFTLSGSNTLNANFYVGQIYLNSYTANYNYSSKTMNFIASISSIDNNLKALTGHTYIYNSQGQFIGDCPLVFYSPYKDSSGKYITDCISSWTGRLPYDYYKVETYIYNNSLYPYNYIKVENYLRCGY